MEREKLYLFPFPAYFSQGGLILGIDVSYPDSFSHCLQENSELVL
jgi:hypothetical protein